MDKHALTVKK